MTQKTIVERMKPLYPALTQPIVSAVVRGRAGVQWTNSFRRAAEEHGITVKRDKEGRVYGNKFTVRLTDAEAAEFYRYLNGTGETAQEVLRNLVLNLIGGR